MFKILATVGVLGAIALYYSAGPGSKLDEGMVRQMYESEAHATLSRDPKALCALFSTKLQLKQEVLIMGQTITETMNQQQACEGARKSFEVFADIGAKVDGILTIEYHYNIDKITLTPNRKTALVQLSRTLKMGEQLMQYTSESSEVVRREWGQVHITKVDAKTRVRMHAGGMVAPELFLQEQ